MSEKQEPAKVEIDYSKISESINASVNEKLDGHFNKIDQKLESVVPKKEEKKEDFNWSSIPDDESDYISKKDFKEFAKEILLEAQKIAGNTSEKIVSKITSKDKERDARDMAAMMAFPMLNNGSPSYDAEFERLVKNEIKERKDRGRKENDPDLLYDAAAKIKATSTKWNKTKEEQVASDTVNYNKNHDHFDIKGGGKGQSGPTEYQLELGKRFNMSEEKLKDHFKNRVASR